MTSYTHTQILSYVNIYICIKFDIKWYIKFTSSFAMGANGLDEVQVQFGRDKSLKNNAPRDNVINS